MKGKKITKAKIGASKRNVMPDRTWPPITVPTMERIDQICRKHSIADQYRNELETRLELIASLAEAMRSDQRKVKGPAQQVVRFSKIARELKQASIWVRQYDPIFLAPDDAWTLDPPGFAELSKAASVELSMVLDVGFINRLSLGPSGVGPKITLKPSANWTVSKNISVNPGLILADMLLRLAVTFEKAGRDLKKATKSGPKHTLIGRMMIANLANFYQQAGKTPSKAKVGPFRRFLDDVLMAMGAPTDFIDGQLNEAIARWQMAKDSPQNTES